MNEELTYKKRLLIFFVTSLIWTGFHIIPVAKAFSLKFVLITTIGMVFEVMVMFVVLDFIMMHRWRKQ